MELYLTINILLLLSCVFENSTQRTKQKVLWFWMLFFTLFGGLRWQTGGDWSIYKGYFDAAEWDWETILCYRRWYGDVAIEPGYMFLSAAVKLFFSEFWGFNLVMGFFAQYTYYRFSMEFSPQRPIMMYALILGMGINSYMFVRSGISIAVCYWGYRYIRDRRLIRFLIVVGLASLVHRQVVLFVSLYWAWNFRFKWQWYVIGYICCIVLYVVIQTYVVDMIFALGNLGDVTEKLQGYTDEDLGEQARGVSYSTWIMYLVMLTVFLYYRKKFGLENDGWYNCLLLGFFIIIASNTIFTGGMSTLGRISTPFKPARTILVMYVVNRLLNSKYAGDKRFALIFFIGLEIINIYKIANDPLMDICFAPYRSIFDFDNLI